jgi:hypothetical protein
MLDLVGVQEVIRDKGGTEPVDIKIGLREIGFGDVDWIHLAEDRDRWRALVNTVMNLRVP